MKTKLIDFLITAKCNYHCEYCDQGTDKSKYPQANDEVIEAFIGLLKTLNFKNWGIIQLVGGEPTIHPRVVEVVKVIVETGNKFQICTNFSRNIEFFLDLIKATGENFYRMQISFHPSQIKDIDEFIDKTIAFNNAKNKDTKLIISAVLTEQDFEKIKYLDEKLNSYNLTLDLQHQRTEDGFYIQYSEALDNFINHHKKVDCANFSEKVNPYGIECLTGIDFFAIDAFGNCKRCYGDNNYLSKLGNIVDGTFNPYNTPIPCLSQKCTCTLPAQCGMINFCKKNLNLAKSLQTITATEDQREIRKYLGLQ